MKIFPICMLWMGAALLGGCRSDNTMAPDKTQISKSEVRVLYYDRNGDGKVDQEKHHYPGSADRDWELRDDNYDGFYDAKILYGFAVTKSVVNLPVPTNVHIESGS